MGGGERLIKGREIEMKAEREREGGGCGGHLLVKLNMRENEVVFC